MNFANVTDITIPEGNVTEITDSADTVLWKSGSTQVYDYVKLIRRALSGKYTNNTVTSIGSSAFSGCYKLTTADFQAITSIGSNAFIGCSALTALILRSEAITDLWDAKAFGSTPIASGTGYIYVPSSLVDSYKVASNWSAYAEQIRAIEDYPDICGGESA